MCRHQRLHHPTTTGRARLVLCSALVSACALSREPARVDPYAAADSAGARQHGSVVAPSSAPQSGVWTTSAAALRARTDTVAAFAPGRLLSLAPARAVPLIAAIEEPLATSSDAQLRALAGDLAMLRLLLRARESDGVAIATVLERLAPKVQAVSARNDALSPTLRSIGDELTRAASALRTRR